MSYELTFAGDTYIDDIFYQFDTGLATRIEFDFRFDPGSAEFMWDVDRYATPAHVGMRRNTANAIRIFFGSTQAVLNLNFNLLESTWYHFRYEWFGDGFAEVESNGVLYDNLTMVNNGTTDRFVIGGRYRDSGSVRPMFNGSIRNFGIWENDVPFRIWQINDNDNLIRDSISGDDGNLTIGSGFWTPTGTPALSTGVQALPSMVQAGAGIVIPPTVGDGSQTLPMLGQMGLAEGGSSGQGMQALPALIQQAQATHPKSTGDASQTLPALIQTGSADVTTLESVGNAAQTLPALVQAGIGTAAISLGDGSQTLPPIAQSAVATAENFIPVEGTGIQFLPALTQEGISREIPAWKDPGCRTQGTKLRTPVLVPARCDI